MKPPIYWVTARTSIGRGNKEEVILKIHVMFLRDHVLRTGGTTYMLETLPQLESARIRSSVCVLESPSSACDSLVRAGIPVDFLKHGKRDPRRFTDLDSVLRRRRPDILHLLGPKSFMRGRLLGLWHGIPTIAHFHSC